MKFSKSLKQAILSDFPVTLATARLFEKSNNLTYLCNLEILHSCKTLKQFGNVLTETTADRKATYGYSAERYFLTSFTGDGPSEGESRSASVSKAGEPATDAITIRTVDGEGNILTETDPNGNLTTFFYDAHNRMLTQTGPLGSGRTMVYDNNGNVLSETTLNTTGNQVRTFVYDGANRRIISTNAQGEITTNTFDGNGNILTQSMPLGKQTAFAYNNLNLVTSKTEANETPAIWSYAYDLTGNLITETQPNNNVITTVYDDLNRPLSKTDSIGLLAQTTYDNNSNVLTETDGNLNISTHTYNALNQRTSTTLPLGRGHTYTYTPFGEILTDTGPNGTITYSYNSLGQRTTASGPDEYNEIYKYDVNDNLLEYTDSRGNKTTYQVNALNQTTSQTTGSFTQSMFYDSLGNKLTETDYRGIVSAYTFDKENRQLTFTRAGKLQQTNVYNTAGLPQSVTDANGNTSTHSYNSQYFKTQTNLPETQVIKFTPNALGDITYQDNPGSNDITNVYDKRRRLISSTNGAGEQTQYEYDLKNNRTAVIKPDNTRYEYTFDTANRLTQITNTAENITTSYGYSNKDNLISITDAENKVTNFSFNNRNRKLSKTYPDGQSVNYSYDNNGNIKTVDLPNGVGITYNYDVLNRKTSESYSGAYGSANINYSLDANGNPESITENIGGNNYTTTMSFDNLDRMISREDVYGNTFVFAYDNNGNRKTFKDHENNLTNYQYDGLNRLDKLTHAGLGTFNWTFNNAGLTNKISYPNGASVQYDYDSANRIASIENKKSGADISKHVYEYDANGNRLKLTESNINIDQDINYVYDKADRLTQVQYPNQTTVYGLDKVGNRTSEILSGDTNLTKTYSYNNRDQLTEIEDDLGSEITYQYDDAGNQLSKENNGVLTTFNYTARNRVKTITVGGAPPVNYQYDYTGQRINHQSNGMEKRFLYDGLTLIAETNTIGNTLARYHYGDRYQLAETRNSTNSYFHVDSMGTNVAVTNQDGSIQARYEYDAYGNLLTQAGSSQQPFGFTGYQKDNDTGLYYANARYYDSETARFNREDPFDGDTNTPPSLHRYLYAFANPNFYVDPSGRCNEAYDGFSFAGCIDRAEDLRSYDDPEAEIINRIELEGAPVAGIAEAGIDAVQGTFELAGQLSATLGEGLSGGYFYNGSARNFKNSLESMGNGIAHPIESVKSAHADHMARVTAFEQAGNHAAAVQEKSRYITTWVSSIFGASKAVSSLRSNNPNMITEGSDNKLAFNEIDQTPKTQVLYHQTSSGIKLESNLDLVAVKTNFDQQFGKNFKTQNQRNAGWTVYSDSLNGKKDLVIGNLTDTNAGSELGLSRLNSPVWSIEINDAWVQGGIDSKKRFYLGSNIVDNNLRNSGKNIPVDRRPKVFLRELKQLREAGYTRVGDYMMPPL